MFLHPRGLLKKRVNTFATAPLFQIAQRLRVRNQRVQTEKC